MMQFLKDWSRHESFPFFLLAVMMLMLVFILSLLHSWGEFP